MPDAGARVGAVGRVSVIIPAYNAAATIERTISSVLNQTYADLEILVVDDGSTDGTASLVRRIAGSDRRIILLQKPNGGLVSARNHGISHASGEFIAPIDADDLWHPQKIEKQVTQMRASGEHVGLIYTWARGIDEEDRVLFDVAPWRFRGSVYAALVIRNFVGSGAPLVRRRCANEVGGYDATLAPRGATCFEDLKFNLDIAERHHFDLVPEFLWGYRFRAGSMSTDTEAMIRSYELIVGEAHARHPELPSQLFRWARGHQHREFGLAYLSGGQIMRGMRLLLMALGEDPLATMRVGGQRLLSRLRRSVGWAASTTARPHSSGGNEPVRPKFLELDPKIPSGRPGMHWSRRRLAYIGGLCATGSPAALQSTKPV